MAATSVASNTAVAVFEDSRQAREAVSALLASGFSDSEIGVVTRNRDQVSDGDSGTQAEEGGATGLAAGAGLGALWGIGILSNVLPGIGPALFGGTLGIILSSAAAGAAAAGIAGALIGMGIPDEDARYYESEVHSGRTVVTVHGGTRAVDAQRIMAQHGGYERSAT